MNIEGIKNYFSKFKKITVTSLKKFEKTNRNDVIQLKEILNNVPQWESIQNIIIGLIKDIQLKHCKKCGKLLTFSKINQDYCSTKCLNNDIQIRDKIRKTCLQKYGTDNPAKSQLIKEKFKNTCLQKYGTDNPAKSQLIKQKSKRTCLQKYGVQFTTQSTNMKEKSSKTKLQKYNNPHFVNIKKRNETVRKQYFNKYLNFLDVEPLFTLDEYTGVGEKQFYKWKCKKCGNVFEDHLYSHHPTCRKCYPLNNGTSKQEKELLDFIKSIYQGEIFENDRNIISPYQLDIVIPEKKLAFEYNGSFWHSTSSPGYVDDNYKCLMKTQLCEKHGYKLIHIWEYNWINPEKQNVLKEKIKAFFGVDQTKIYARKCVIKQINSNIKNDFLNKHHIQGEDKSKVKLGLFYQNELVAVMTFGKPRFNKKYQYQLIRYATSKHVIGGAGKLLKYFKVNYHPKSIITYADRCYSQGNLYRKIGFNELKQSRPNYFYVNESGIKLLRYQCQKHKLAKLLGDNFHPELTEEQNMTLNKFYKIYDCGNLVFEIY